MSKLDCLKLCFITLELAAVIWNEWWVWVLGLRMAKFSLIYIIFGLDHSLVCFFKTSCWHSSVWFPSNHPSQNRFTSCFSREALLALSSSEKGKLKASSLVFRMPGRWCIKNHHSKSMEQKLRKILVIKVRNERGNCPIINRAWSSSLLI